MAPAPARAAPPEESGLHFGDLGIVVVDRAGTTLPLAGRRLPAALSVLLIHANERVSVDTLVSALWGDRAGGRREETLQSHMWRLRQALEPHRRRGEPFTTVVHDSSGYRLLATTEQVDSLRFGELAAEASTCRPASRPSGPCSAATTGWRSGAAARSARWLTSPGPRPRSAGWRRCGRS